MAPIGRSFITPDNGMEMNGAACLLPVDAKLKKERTSMMRRSLSIEHRKKLKVRVV